jgi:hypothetical protein
MSGHCEDEHCGDETPYRRFRCWHCGLLVCGWCWNHIHRCEPGHKRSECRDLAHYRRYGRRWIERLRARKEVAKAAQEPKA